MRKLSIILICSVFTTCLFAQWEVKGGIDFSTIPSYPDAKTQPGFHIGATYDVPLSSKFYFQPGLLFTTNGFNIGKLLLVKKARISMYALELPLLFSFRPKIGENIKLITHFGLYGRYGLFGRQKYEYIDNTSEKESSFGPYNRGEIGLDLGIGFSYKRVSLLGSFQRSFTHAEKDINGSRHQKWRIGLGYGF